MENDNYSDTMQNSQGTSACSQCRARKVKCDRIQTGCSPCLRRELNCTYPQRHSRAVRALPSVDTDSDELVKAGIKRRRVRCACEPCRIVKARCTGDSPCDRCQKRDLECIQPATAPSQSQPHPGGTPNMAGEASMLTPCTRTTQDFLPGSASDSLPIIDVPERELIQSFLDRSGMMSCSILHGPTTLSQWSKGKIDDALLRIVCAAGLRARDSSDRALFQARTWMREVQASLLSRLDVLSLARLQALVLLVELQLDIGDRVEGWNLLAMAARAGFTLKLNHERPEMEPVMREMRRRTMWQIYLFDRQASGGITDLSVCASERMLDLQLPCDDRTFERGMPSRAENLIPSEESREVYRDMDIIAYLIRLFYIRHKVLSYTKRVLRERSSPESSREELHALEAELIAFGSQLPSDLQLQAERLTFMAQSRDAHGYFIMHTTRLQCYCDLYRFLVPGIREAVSKEAFDTTPPSYVSYCQRQCLVYAAELCSLWSSIYGICQAKPIDSLIYVVSLYQVSQLLTQLQNLLSQNDPPYSAETLRRGLKEALAMVSPRLSSHPGPTLDLLRETSQLIEAFGQGRPRDLSSGWNGCSKRTALHMASKGSLIPRGDSSDSEQGSSRDNGPSDQTTAGIEPSSVPIVRADSSHGADATENVQAHTDAMWPPQPFHNDDIVDRDVYAELMPWAGLIGDFETDYGIDFSSFGADYRGM